LVSDITRWVGNDARSLQFTAGELAARARDEPVLHSVLSEGLTVAGPAPGCISSFETRGTDVRTQPCTAAIRRGRLRKAEQFIEAAGTVRDLADGHEDVADAYVTLCVHAGIAASDVICCASLGEHAQGEDHGEAVGLREICA
jgi:hypothetical protein